MGRASSIWYQSGQMFTPAAARAAVQKSVRTRTLGVKFNPDLETRARDFYLAAFASLGMQPTEAELQGVMSIGKHEGSYGRGWLAGSPMEGSHNQGAIQCCKALEDGTCPPGSALQGDSHPDGSKYTVCFRTYPSDEAGAADLIKLLYNRKNVPEALASGDLYRLAKAMFEASYFEGTCKDGDDPGTGTGKEKHCAAEPRIARYAGALFTAAKDSAEVVGYQLAVLNSGGSAGGGASGDGVKTFGVLLTLGSLAVLGGYLWRRNRRL